MAQTVIIAGFFPPPITGQGLATQRLAALLSDHYHVESVNLREGEENLDLRVKGRILYKIQAYRNAGRRLKEVLARFPEATVFWTSVSPQVSGHFRDLLTILPHVGPAHRVYGVVHWGKFADLFASRLTGFTAQRMSKRLEGLVFLNEDRAHQCAPWLPDHKRLVIPNTLDAAVVCTDEEVERKIQQRTENTPLHVLFLSNMIREKGYFDVLEAIALLHRKGKPIKATFAGQWLSEDDRAVFDQFVTQNNLKPIVNHVGKVTERDHIKALHLDAHVFILPSYLMEGQPLTIIEALNAGSPVITTRLGGMVDMIEEGQEGFFVPHQDPRAIAEAISKLIAQSMWGTMALAARQRYAATYSAEQVTQAWASLVKG